MTHYRMQDGVPTGIILAKNPRTGSLDELKTYNENTIYLNDGNEFQIRLFNPLQEKIGVRIGLNGDLSQSYLVLNPGQDVTIDRFIDTQKKMLFETYQYDSDNKLAQIAVAKNGIVEIKFFKEYTPITYISDTYYYTKTLYNDTSGGKINLNDFNTSGALNLTNISTNSVTTDNFVSSTYTSSNLEFKSEEPTKSLQKSLRSKMKETGRVGKGSTSSQKFERVEAQFEYFPFYQVNYNLKPISEKEEDITIKEYCTQCGFRKRNPKYMYCPKCGNKF